MTLARIACAGVNHVTSPVEQREALAFTLGELRDALPAVAETYGSGVILSTCNRTELYATVAPGDEEQLAVLLNDLKGAAIDRRHFYVLEHEAAVEHLYRVASGIDSMVLGESQILGQVREAMSAATEAGTLNGALTHVFHSAISVGRRARTETNIGRHAVSVSSAAVALARRSLGDLENKTVLVISAGSMGKLAAKALAQQSAGSRILVANRTLERAQELAAQLGPRTEALSLDHLRDAVADSDIVISGTSADGFIIGPEHVSPVMSERFGRELLFIDIAVPRDIDPAVRSVPGVHLCDIDDIEAVTSEGWNGRAAEVEKVETIVREEVAAFLAWWDSLDAVPVIAALRERAENIRLGELERTLARLELDAEARRRIEAMTEAIVKKMLDRPIARLKDGAGQSLYIEALEDLFDIHPNGRRPRP